MTDVLIPLSLLRAPDRFRGVDIGDCRRGQPVWKDGRLTGLTQPSGQEPVQILIPKLVEAHCHLDKCHTLHRLEPACGDLKTAIAAQSADKANWTPADIRARALTGLSEARAAGCQWTRSHIDWGADPTPPMAWNVVRDLNAPDLQIAALTGIDQMANLEFAEAVAHQVARDTGILGSFILHHPPDVIRQGLQNIFHVARSLDLMLDFHVDEDLGTSNGLELIADAALESGFDRPVLCGHAVSLINQSGPGFGRISDKLARAGITICALPSTNLALQGRNGGTPVQRGLTRLTELRAAGVRVIVASDNVADAFCPTGRHDPMHALNLATLAAHLDPPFGQWLSMITTDARTAIGLDSVYVDGARAEDLLMSNATSIAGLISGSAILREVTL